MSRATLQAVARSGKLERELAALAPAEAAPAGAGAAPRIAAALRSRHAHVLARAAAIVKEHALDVHRDALLDALAGLDPGAAKRDPGCYARVALLDALDHLEHADPAPFLAATRHVQMEKRWGPPEDTAIGVRARGALALVRLRYSDALLVLGRLLADPQPQVRQAAATALGHHGDRLGAALLLLRLEVGEEDPAALAEHVRALVALAPDAAGPAVAPLLADPELRELVAHALIDANRDEGVELLLDELERCVLDTERAPLLRALAVSRRPAARAHVLAVVAGGAAAEARLAIEALAVHAFDPRLREDVRAAAARNDRADLGEVVDRAWGPRRD